MNGDDDFGGRGGGGFGPPGGGRPGGMGGMGAPIGGGGGLGGMGGMEDGRGGALRLVGGTNPPTRRPDLIAAVRHWHRGMRNRTSGELEPWKAIVLTHLDTGRAIRQWDLRSDEDDEDLSAEIEMVMESHGKPLARSTGTGQTYQLDCYFGMMTTPQASWTGDVRAEASLDAFGSPHLRARGTPQDFDQQRYRHNELQMQASFGLTRFNVELLVSQLQDARAEIARMQQYVLQVEDRERKVREDEERRQAEAERRAANEQRINFLIAKGAKYIPIFAARLDQKLFGLTDLSADEKEHRASEIVRMLLSKLNEGEGEGGMEKLSTMISLLNLSEKEQEKLQEVGVMFWLEEQRRQLHKEAEMSGASGGFAGLGNDVEQMQTPTMKALAEKNATKSE